VVGCSLSLSAFAGSLELLVVGMIASTAPLAAIAITVFVVNFRHVFYAFSFPGISFGIVLPGSMPPTP
jgi:predicted branched-subunit amino acid permease